MERQNFSTFYNGLRKVNYFEKITFDHTRIKCKIFKTFNRFKIFFGSQVAAQFFSGCNSLKCFQPAKRQRKAKFIDFRIFRTKKFR